MTDDGSAPTIPETAAPRHSPQGTPLRAPDPRYAMRTLLGRGGMGEIWLAHDLRIDRDVAIKLMRGDGAHDPDAVARFLREARVQGRLEHPSIVPVHDLGGDDTAPYFAMKRLTGRTLADVLAAQARGEPAAVAEWPRRTLLARLVDVCLAVELAHQRGVIHRDLKPANLMLGDFGECYVLDWGLARIADSSDPDAIRASDLRSDSDSGGQTVAGSVLGTPGYMAPEQMRGEPVDRRTDLYALGCVLFEIVAGRPAVPRDQAFEVTLAAACHRPSARGDADVPPELDDLCARATAADPSARPESARAIADAIQRYLDGDRDLERRRTLAVEHAGRAGTALLRGDEAARAEAMREAGRAIALDPENRAAQAVLARLLLEPPATIPAPARAKIEDERQRAGQTVMRAGILAYAVFLVLIPLVKLLGVTETWPFVVVGGQVAVLLGLTTYGARSARLPSRAVIVGIVGLHLALVATVGALFGALMFVPVLVFGSLPVMLVMPSVRFPVWCLALHLLAVAVPFTLELSGVIPRSFELTAGSLVLRPWAVHIAPGVLLFALVATIVAQMVINTVILDTQRRDQERAQEKLHVQAWQLEQLVPATEPAT